MGVHEKYLDWMYADDGINLRYHLSRKIIFVQLMLIDIYAVNAVSSK